MDKKDFLQASLPVWEKLSQAEQESLVESSVAEKFAGGSTISRTDAGCRGAMLLQCGQLRVYMLSEEGRDITLYRLHAGEMCVLSASCLLDTIAFDVIIEAVADTEVMLIPAPVLHQIKEKNPYMALFLSESANERFSDVMWTMQQLLFMKADQRVAIFLWDEMQRAGSPIIAYTHEEIARLMGSAREVVTRMLKYFAEEGIVKPGRGKIEIVDKEKLKKLL